jgi:flagellar hook-associated protein 3 FlgL
MSMNRITSRAISQSSLAGLQTNLGRLAKVQEQLSSGRTINRPSDSPAGTVSAMQFRSEASAAEQHVRNAEDGKSWLATIDTTLTKMIDEGVNKARDLTVQGLSTGSGTPQTREALAAQVDQIRQSLLTDANATYLGRPVFGGVTSASVAYNPDGSYAGTTPPPVGSLAAPAVVRKVGPSTEVRVDITGPEIFEMTDGSGRNLFTVLEDISASLRDNSIGLSPLLSDLDAVKNGMLAGVADVGARAQRVDSALQTAKDSVISLTNSLTEVESTDVPAAIVEMKLAEMSYQAALAATSRAIQPSLADWLR